MLVAQSSIIVFPPKPRNDEYLFHRQGLNVLARMGRFVEFSVFGRDVTCDWSIISKIS